METNPTIDMMIILMKKSPDNDRMTGLHEDLVRIDRTRGVRAEADQIQAITINTKSHRNSLKTHQTLMTTRRYLENNSPSLTRKVNQSSFSPALHRMIRDKEDHKIPVSTTQ